MSDTNSKKRQVENEAVFRQANEKIEKGLRKESAKERAEGHDAPHQEDDDLPLHFYCECADENCHERVILKAGKYRDLHKNRKQFLIAPDHEVDAIERVVDEKPMHTVVKKYASPPENPTGLNRTSIQNA